jgi:hypothetical protein
VADYGPTLSVSSAQNAVGNDDAEAPAALEGLRTLTRRYVLDPGTRIETVDIGPNRYGRRKITITLEAADGI